jgi:ABC-type glutathione transport system ATPase component
MAAEQAHEQMVVSPLVLADGVRKEYRRRGPARVALAGVSFTLEAGRTLAVVGESGAGKSTLARLVCGLDHPTQGTILVAGTPPRPSRGSPSPVQMVFQNPHDALNPYLAVGQSVGEPLRHVGRAERRRRVAELLELVGLDASRVRERPSAFSGGQLQRVVIARALAADPAVLLCDEPTSALDVSVQAQIINLLLRLQDSLRFACLLITHDLGVARVMADDVLILRDGMTVEQTTMEALLEHPAHEYSRTLIDAASAQALQHGMRRPIAPADLSSAHERGAQA